jgi:hypothetical protein
MRVLVCGGRHYGFKLEQRDHVWGVLSEYEDIEIIHGNARGVDKTSGAFAETHERPHHVYPAQWEKYGKAAGPIRNKQMLDEGKPDLVIAFLAPNSRGTQNMIDQATKAGLPVKIVEIE